MRGDDASDPTALQDVFFRVGGPHPGKAVVSLQVIEPLWDQPGHLAECRRVLRPGGALAVSTPNRLTFSPGYDPATDQPRNIYHTREFSPAELSALCADAFATHTVYGVHAGPRIRPGLVEAQLARPAEDWPGELARAVAGVRVDDFQVTADDPDNALDLIIIAAR